MAANRKRRPLPILPLSAPAPILPLPALGTFSRRSSSAKETAPNFCYLYFMTNPHRELYGEIDIYLFDQLLKGGFDKCRRIVDIGCGGGRNLHYFLKNGYEVFGVDKNEHAIACVQELAARIAPGAPSDNFVVAGAESIPFEPDSFDLVLCSALLHFANDKQHFEEMLQSAWSMVKPGGFFFARLASNISIEHLVVDIGHGRYLLPDDSERYLVDMSTLHHYTHALNAELFEPIKTTNVQNLRAMTTWCLQKK